VVSPRIEGILAGIKKRRLFPRRGIETETEPGFLENPSRCRVEISSCSHDDSIEDIQLTENIEIAFRGLVKEIEKFIHMCQNLFRSHQVETVQSIGKPFFPFLELIGICSRDIQFSDRLEEFFIHLKAIPAANKPEFPVLGIEVGHTDRSNYHDYTNRDDNPIFEHTIPLAGRFTLMYIKVLF